MIHKSCFPFYTMSKEEKRKNMRRLGISLYPDKTELQDDQRYLEIAKQYRYERVFMSFLQIDINDPMRSIARIKESALLAHTMGFSVTLDIHPMVFQYLKCKEDDLSYFHAMGVDVLRLDKGYDGVTEARMTHNPYGITIEVNMSNHTHYLQRILDQEPDVEHLTGSHNFYPQRYTGLSVSRFLTCCQIFHEHHIHSAAFLTSPAATISPWPVSEGLCTLECHRDLPLYVQAKHMKLLRAVDDIIIADAYASEEELRQVREVMDAAIDEIQVELYEETSELEKELLFQGSHEYRGDASEFVIRSSRNRMKYHTKQLPPHKEHREIHRGDILILNETYGQYKAEVQIALLDREPDPRINVAGHISEKELVLLDALRPFQTFQLKEKRDEE